MRLAWDVFLRDLLRDKLTEMISVPTSKLVAQPASQSGGTSRLLQNADLEKSTPSSTSENAPTGNSRQEQIRLDASDPSKILDSVKPFINDDDNNSPEE